MIKNLRKSKLINKPVRIVLKKFFGKGLDQAKKNLPRWRIIGQVEIELDGEKFKLFSNFDDWIVDLLYYRTDNYSETKQLILFGELIKRSKLALDIGANTGLYSVFSALKNKDCDIWAFEPYDSNQQRLKLNLLLNNIKNVVPIEKAVGEQTGKLLIAVPSDGHICDVASADIEFTNKYYREAYDYIQVEVEQIKLDDLIKDRKVDLIKIDVENYELPVFRGALDILRDFSPVIQCEMFVDDERRQFYREFLKPLGYKCYLMLENGIAFSEELQPNFEGRDFLFTKRKLNGVYFSYKDKSLAEQLIPNI